MSSELHRDLIARRSLQAISDVLKEQGEPWVVPGSQALTPGTRAAVEALVKDLRS